MAQTTITNEMPEAQLGLIADSAVNDIITLYADEDIPVGRGVRIKGGTEDVCILPTGQGILIQGVAALQDGIEQDENGVVKYADKSPVNVLHRGRIWVWVTEAVTQQNNVYCVSDTAGGEALGQFRSDNTNATLVKNAVYLTATSGAGLALIEIYPEYPVAQ
jgi:hypothetical protein